MQSKSFISFGKLTELMLRARWPWHLGFWFLYALSRAFTYYLTVMFYERVFLEFMLITEVSFVVLVYATTWLYDRYFAKDKLGVYFLSTVLIWLSYFALVVTFQKHYLRDIPNIANTEWIDIYLNNVTKYIFTLALVTLAKYFKDNFIAQQREAQNKQLQMQSELEHLKAQISPHFLFNTMNNFYGLAVERSAKLPELMVRLSGLLRYSLYETKNATVPLCDEINYLRNYIELEKIRLEDNLDFAFEASSAEHSQLPIAPLLLVVFVENAFKHAKNVTDQPIKIRISIALDSAERLQMRVTNNYREGGSASANEEGGIGLANVQTRLKALYPGENHALHISKSDQEFQVDLRVQLNQQNARAL